MVPNQREVIIMVVVVSFLFLQEKNVVFSNDLAKAVHDILLDDRGETSESVATFGPFFDGSNDWRGRRNERWKRSFAK